MAELIDKGALIEKLKRTSAFECIRNSADKNVFEIIEDFPTTTEAEIRAMILNEVLAKAREIQEEQIKNLEHSSMRGGKQWAIYMNTHLGHIQTACRRLLKEQLKEE